MDFTLSAVLKNKIGPHTYLFDLIMLNNQTLKTTVFASEVVNASTGKIINCLSDYFDEKISDEVLENVSTAALKFAQAIDKSLES